MQYQFDIPELKRMREGQQLEEHRITIEICKTPLDLAPRVQVNVNHAMNWKTFAWLMEAFSNNYKRLKVNGMNALMDNPKALVNH